MSTPLTSAAQDPAAGPPDTRGMTRLSPYVVERIAAFACHRATAVVTPQLHPDAPRSVTPRARAEIDGKLARLSVFVGVEYPTPVGAFAAGVRSMVTAEVERLCGLRVVGIAVEAMPVNLRRRRRVL